MGFVRTDRLSGRRSAHEADFADKTLRQLPNYNNFTKVNPP
jgi:hypothetical protein